ncbi:MAG: endolytic transglycosylase MltG [Acidimicrobiales bacterium]|nr:endolytic transglycosylase MltG [Acidimicrobiales bacterium]
MSDWNERRDPFEDHEWDDWDEWDDEYVVGVRPPMARGKKALIGAGMVVGILVVAGGALLLWVQNRIDPSGDPGDELEVEVAEGSTTEDIGEVLADNDVITSSLLWNYWTRFNDEGPFQAGLYVFQENSSFGQAVEVLEAGPLPPENVRVTIPEGLTIAEIVPRLADPETGVERWTVDNLQAALDSGEIRSQFQPPDQPSMEGMLFPETYEIDEETDERTFVRRLVTQLDETLLELDVEARAAELGVTPYEIMIIASLIEEEARVDGDRGKISRVIHNRLAEGMPLGIDATSRYEAEIQGRSREDIDFESDSPYNTRRVQGLPPTPIASAGRASIEAALAPEPGEWLYYVLADEEGNHTFAETNAEFQRAKQECIRLDLGCG